MPVPRLFEASSDAHVQWTHVLATLLALAGPSTRTALVEEISGESLPEADAMHVRELRPLGEDGRVVGDVVARGAGWTFAVQSTLGFDADEADRLRETYDALNEVADRTILVAVTPDRRPPASVEAAREGGRDIRHRSWLRVRDWVQERPERGRAEGVDLMLLREAEYFLTPRVAELYRLESVSATLPAGLRRPLAAAFFDLNDIAPAPTIQSSSPSETVIRFPRTGDAAAEIVASDGSLSVRIASDRPGPGTTASDGWQVLAIDDERGYADRRAWVRATASEALPARR